MHLVALPDIGQKMYIDPMNYVDAENAVSEFTNEIDPALLSLERVIGGGKNCKIFSLFLLNNFTLDVDDVLNIDLLKI